MDGNYDTWQISTDVSSFMNYVDHRKEKEAMVIDEEEMDDKNT